MLTRRTPMRRSPLARSSSRPKRTVRFTGPMPDVTAAVLERATLVEVPCCEVCADPIVGRRGVDWALHHRRGRDGRPDSHMPQNLLVVHGADNVSACHGRIHRNEGGESVTNGWLITRNGFADPRMVAVLVGRGSRWVYLSAEGGYTEEPECAS